MFDAQEIRKHAPQNSLMSENYDWFLLSLYPINEGLESADDVHIRFPTGIPKV